MDSPERSSDQCFVFFAGIMLAVILPLLVVLKPVANAQGSFFDSDPLQGQQLFKTKGCQNCHAIRGQGGSIATDLGWHQYFGNAFELASDLWNHSPIMREVMEEMDIQRPVFTDDEMADVIAFLYYQRFLKTAGNVLRGKELLSEKGCLKCHTVRGQGGKIAQRLDKLPEYVSPLFMAQAMWNHGPEMADKMRELDMAWPTFDPEEIVDLTSYLRILRKDSHTKEIYVQPGDPQSGGRLLENKECLRCHSVRGEGGSIGPDFAQLQMNHSVTEIAGLMWNHGSEMMETMKEEKIAWPRFQGNEMADVISYLYSINFFGQPGDGTKGKTVFEAKGCIQCHSEQEGTKSVGPELSEFKGLKSPMHLAEIMWNHAPGMEMKMKEADIEWPQFDSSEMQDLYAYFTNLDRF